MSSSPSTPQSRNVRLFIKDVSVEFEPPPAMTGILPAIASTVQRTIAASSACSVVLDSPVVPSTTMPSVPFSTCQLHSSFSFS
ncbi:MAG: hypothetical protein BWY81_00226 [Firmicutes bacterium ADurb.Bin467]|nr:MAG: hypothetical protein BWY81_00226 [Firmicutes bacterium ADurb.Bin467]